MQTKVPDYPFSAAAPAPGVTLIPTDLTPKKTLIEPKKTVRYGFTQSR